MKFLPYKNEFNRTWLFTLVLSIALTMAFYGCKKPIDGISLIVDTSPLTKSPLLVQFVNANSNSTTSLPSSFLISLSGSGAAYVQVDGGGTNFTVKNGVLPLSLTKTSFASVTSPIIFNIYANIPGFAPMSQTVSITTNNANQLKLALIEYANPAEGTTALVKQTPLSGGVSPVAILSTSATSVTTQTATINIPAGTQMLDGNGIAINANNLTTDVVQYGTTKTTALAAYPGGFSPYNVVYGDGTPIVSGIHFIPAGSVTIDMQADGTPVSRFSKPLPVSVELKTGLINFNTGKPVAAGDTIPLWSMNQNVGQWRLEGNATVALDAKGVLAANFSISHLTVYDLDWWWASNGSYNTCQNKLQINLHPSTTNYFTGEQYRVQLETPGGDQLFAIKDIDPRYDGLSLSVDSLPLVSSAKLTVYNTSTSPWTVVGSTATFAPCSTNSIDVSFTAPAAVDVINTTFNISAMCTNKNVVAYPTGWVFVNDVTNGTTVNIYFEDGHIYNSKAPANQTAQFVNGHQYIFSTVYSGTNYQSGQFTLDKSNLTIPPPQPGTGFSGSATYSSPGNMINIQAAFTLSNCN